MMIENSSSSYYADPLDQIPSWDEEEYHVYQSLDEVAKSQGSISNILGKLPNPPKAPTPLLKRRPRKPLAERSNLPPVTPPLSSKKSDEKIGSDICRSRKDRFLFWKNKSKKKFSSVSLKGNFFDRAKWTKL